MELCLFPCDPRITHFRYTKLLICTKETVMLDYQRTHSIDTAGQQKYAPKIQGASPSCSMSNVILSLMDVTRSE